MNKYIQSHIQTFNTSAETKLLSKNTEIIMVKLKKKKEKKLNDIYTYALWLKITEANFSNFLQHLLSLYIHTTLSIPKRLS